MVRRIYLFKRGKYFYVQYFDESSCKIRKISTKQKSHSGALEFLSEFEAELLKAEKPKYISLKSFTKEYKDFIKSTKSESYYESVDCAFRLFNNYTGNPLLHMITSRMAEKFIGVTFIRTKSGAHTYYKTIRAAFNKAKAWNYIKDNPFLNFKPPKMEKSFPSYIDNEGLNKILAVTDSVVIKNLYIIAFNTGMRRGELVNLKWKSIDLINKMIKVENGLHFTTKNKNERYVPINESSMSALKNVLPNKIKYNQEHYVFNSRGFKLDKCYLSKRFKKAVSVICHNL